VYTWTILVTQWALPSALVVYCLLGVKVEVFIRSTFWRYAAASWTDPRPSIKIIVFSICSGMVVFRVTYVSNKKYSASYGSTLTLRSGST